MIGKYHIPEHVIHFNRMDDDADGYYIWQYASIEKFLRNFGHLITKLDFSSVPFTQLEMTLLNQQIAQYCSNSLTEMQLSEVGFHLFSETNQTFTNVRVVHLRYHNFVNNFELSRIYPKMERLKIVSRYPLAFDSIVCAYPHLKHLELNEWGTPTESRIIHRLLESNLQLESLLIDGLPEMSVLKYASEHLSNLTALALACHSYRLRDSDGFVYDPAQKFDFHNVRELILTIGWEALDTLDQLPITFGQLEILKISWTSSLDAITELIDSNDQLKVLSMPLTDTLESLSSVLAIVGRLAYLEEIRLQWSGRVLATDTLRLLNDFDHLKVITFVVKSGGDYDSLSEIVPRQWQFVNKYYDDAYFRYYVTYERRV